MSALTLGRLGANELTLLRFWAALPLGILVLLPGSGLRLAVVALFAAAALTDLLDGYLARRRDETSLYGAWLDPLADKFLALGVMIALLANGEITSWNGLAVLLIILRELYITALRGYLALLPDTPSATAAAPHAAHDSRPLATSWLAKWKTALQFSALLVILCVPLAGEGSSVAASIRAFGLLLLWISAGAALLSGWNYHRTAAARLSRTGAKGGGDETRGEARK